MNSTAQVHSAVALRAELKSTVSRLSRRRILILLLFAVALFRVAVVPIRITGMNMEPTLKSGDHLLIKRAWLNATKLKRFQVVTVQIGRELLTKRVIALPGEVVRMTDGVLD